METEKQTGRNGDVKSFHFNSVYRFIRKFPIAGLRYQLLILYNNVTGWVSITFYNLPKNFPVDFKFERSKWRDPFSVPVNKEYIRRMTTTRVGLTESEEISQELKRETGSNKFKVNRESRQHYPVSAIDLQKLYNAIRKVGFIHFYDSGDTDNLPHGGSYSLTANGVTYIFIEYTYVHPCWLKGMQQIDTVLDQMIGKEV